MQAQYPCICVKLADICPEGEHERREGGAKTGGAGGVWLQVASLQHVESHMTYGKPQGNSSEYML